MKNNDYAIYGLICFAAGLIVFGLPLNIACIALGITNIIRHGEQGTALGVLDIVLGAICVCIWIASVAV